MKSQLKALLMLPLLFAGGKAFAVCDFGGTSLVTLTMNAGSIVIQRDLPVGTTFATIVSAGTSSGFGCTTAWSYKWFPMIFNVAAPISNSEPVWKTNIAGVGVSFGQQSPVAMTANHYGYWPTGRTLYFIKYDATGSGPLTTGYVQQARVVSPTTMTGMNVQLTGGSITTVACSINTTSLTFPIGEVNVNTFSSTVGFINPKQNTQNLGLTCDVNANVNVTMSGTQNPDTTNTSVLKLTNQGSAGVATGIGVQLVYGSTPLTLNSTIFLKKATIAATSLPLIARYYQTKSTVTTGDANSSATLTLTYQ
ncbi:PhfB family protein [Buttiauxella brennerae ATCC 51605]|jgi:type 1 fimbria pilin|uniref:PhfB family protein n=1 Tax=Buttiauxella brennerae ATCC 51605 TaxID=1354251 RepID=A0A1B7IQ26_9ENTR|nr:fimbrial protein [Buttiauxella brennerae]OAT31839.1 PhfB family protein [Buttiauxella brennerae ATCC 51605]